jgi:hypothetical protein
MRTYARLQEGEVLGPSTWIEAVRAGRTFVTSAPLLRLAVAGQGPGGIVTARLGEVLSIHAEARSAEPVDRLEIVMNGEIIASSAASVIRAEVDASTSGWIAARCHSARQLIGGACVFAHTSPVFLEVEGRPVRPTAATIEPFVSVLDETCTWVEGKARPENDKQREHLREVLRAARDELLSRVRG